MKHAHVRAFLMCPIQGESARNVKVSAVVDHSGTALDKKGSGQAERMKWGVGAKDERVVAFNGEVGVGARSASEPYGYAKAASGGEPGPFFATEKAKGEINYVGAEGAGDVLPATHYLNYDGHAGYDYPYPEGTPIVAAAAGDLRKASTAGDGVYGAGWESEHSFYIKHSNGYESWYRHCERLASDIEAEIGDSGRATTVAAGQVVAYVGSVGAASAHLHCELHDPTGAVADPYQLKLWL